MLRHLVSRYLRWNPQHSGKRTVLRTLLAVSGSRPVKSRYGVLLHPDRHDKTNLLSLLGAYDDVHEPVIAIEPGMAFIDIGANAGLFSLVAARKLAGNGIVLSFEPNAKLYRRLVANIAANGFTNVFPFRAAVGDDTRLARFSPGTANHTGVGHLSDQGTDVVIQFGGVALSELLTKTTDGRAIIIKIDVEGAEPSGQDA